MSQEKVPRWFLQAYLKVKGWKQVFYFRCLTCHVDGAIVETGIRDEVVDHPVKWLWRHARQGHIPAANFMHGWKRAVGSPYAWQRQYEDWGRWWWATWNPETKQFDLEVEVTFRDGEEVVKGPYGLWKVVR